MRALPSRYCCDRYSEGASRHGMYIPARYSLRTTIGGHRSGRQALSALACATASERSERALAVEDAAAPAPAPPAVPEINKPSSPLAMTSVPFRPVVDMGGTFGMGGAGWDSACSHARRGPSP